jgi:hypothetical protein
VVPYTVWRPQEFFLQDEVCWDAGGMTFDPASGRLFMIERGLGEAEMNAAVVHVWQVEGGGGCSLGCNATAPASAPVGSAVSFAVTTTTSGCDQSPVSEWDFGDGSPHSSAENPSHTYQAAGTYTWRVDVSADSATCSDSGQITVEEELPSVARYLVPGVAHAGGVAGSVWRSDLVVVNATQNPASLALTLTDHDTGAITTVDRSVPAGATEEWVDVLVSVLGLAETAQAKGILEISSTQQLAVSCRTYNQETAQRTYGQMLPALTEADALAGGEEGIVPHLKEGSAYRTNLGVVNLGDVEATVVIRVFDSSGQEVGSQRSITLGSGRWRQQSAILDWVGAGERDIAYARLEVSPAAALVWAYASLVDNETGDPTTITVVQP